MGQFEIQLFLGPEMKPMMAKAARKRWNLGPHDHQQKWKAWGAEIMVAGFIQGP